MTLFQWEGHGLKATSPDHPSVGLRADTLADLHAVISRFEAPFVAAAEAERAAEENRRSEEARVAAGVGVDIASRVAAPYPGLVPEGVVRPGQEVVTVA